MPTLKDYSYGEVTDASGRTHAWGSRSAPEETTVDGVVVHSTVTLATATSLTLWTSAGTPTNFDYFWIKANVQLKLELTVDRGAEVGLEEIVILIPANKSFKLPTDDALASYSGTLSGGTSDTIDDIQVRNESGSTATIEYVILT